ncbi:MAG: hypothetical protein C0483_16190 [Pirellula sp.]|nr:hypothetical protein [Pirellula sp.]
MDQRIRRSAGIRSRSDQSAQSRPQTYITVSERQKLMQQSTAYGLPQPCGERSIATMVAVVRHDVSERCKISPRIYETFKNFGRAPQ